MGVTGAVDNRNHSNSPTMSSEVRVDSPTSTTSSIWRGNPPPVTPQPLFDESSDNYSANSSVEVAILPQERKQQRLRTNRWASHVARNPWWHLMSYLMVALALSAYGIIVGDLSVLPDLVGWLSRGTEMASKQQQIYIVQLNTGGRLSYDGGWDELTTNIQPSWENTFDESFERRRLEEETTTAQDNPFDCDLDW